MRDQFFLAIVAVLTASTAAGQAVATLEITKPKWHEDLKFYAAELPKRHINAFHHISREQLEAEVSALDRRIDALDGDGVFVGLVHLAADIGDGHTNIAPPDDVGEFPLDVRRFGDDYRVVAVADASLKVALGARIVKIHDTPFARARELLLSLTPQDENPNLGLARMEATITEGLYLHGLGIIPDRNTAHYTLADDDGKPFTIEVHATSLSESKKLEWNYVFQHPPLSRQISDAAMYYQYLPDSRTVYCNFRRYNDIRRNAAGLFELVKLQHPDKLVIDLRQNGGGDYTMGQHWLIDPIKGLTDLNTRGHLFILIGPYTYSAAMSNAAQFRSQTAAMLVGEPIGEKPNSYQEVKEMRLPNSHLLARYSVKEYKFVESGDNIIRPDQEIDRDWETYKAGRDPVLEWVFEYQAPARVH